MFIAIEGPDGVGKTSIINELDKVMEFVRITEPTGEYRQKIKDIIDTKWEDLTVSEHREVLNLVLKSRKENLHNRILPSILTGVNVITDRWSLSTSVYQIYPMMKRLGLIQGLYENDVKRVIEQTRNYEGTNCACVSPDIYVLVQRKTNNPSPRTKFLQHLYNSLFLYSTKAGRSIPYVLINEGDINNVVKKLKEFLLTQTIHTNENYQDYYDLFLND